MKTIFQNAAYPDEAETWFSHFEKALGKSFSHESKAEKNFLKIFGNSKFLSRLVTRFPELWLAYEKSKYQEKEKPFDTFLTELQKLCSSCVTEEDFITQCKKYKYQEYLRLTIKELSGLEQDQIHRELSHLATAISQTLLKKVHTDQSSDFCIIAMGKLGGLELNYSSDIDIIGFYEKDGEVGSTTYHELFTNTFTRFGNLLSQKDDLGFLYRVDWDLRPEGKTGVLANSISAAETYYQTFGEEWERQAFIRANVLFQSNALGNDFMRMINHFVYRKYIDAETLKSLCDIKSRILTQTKTTTPKDCFNIKTGPGGIRDIEFLTQGLQLLYGGKIKELRSPNTEEALRSLNKHEIITSEELKNLIANYYFLRKLETSLQMEEERQVQTLKKHPQDYLINAKRMGITHATDEETSDRFQEKLEKTLQMNEAIYRKYFDE